MIVHPRKKLSAKIAPLFCFFLLVATTLGMKYMKMEIAINTSAPILGSILTQASRLVTY